MSKPFSFQLISLIEKHCRFLLHTKIACDLRVFHDFVLRSFVKVQGHRKKKFVTRVCFISFLCRTIGGFYFTKNIAYYMKMCHKSRVKYASSRSLFEIMHGSYFGHIL